MKIGSVKENKNIEKRIAITPDIVKKYSSHGFEICLSENYGTHIGIDDKQYLDFGVKIFKNDNAKSLQKRILKQEHKIYPEALKMILN